MSDYDLEHINGQTFISYYEFNKKDDYSNFITMLIFVFSTISTIGFGYYNPRSDEERLFNIIIFFVGVTIILYLINRFIQLIMKFQLLNDNFDEGEQLTIFFDLFKKLNGEKELDLKLKFKIMLHFDNKWNTDRNQATDDPDEIAILE